MPPMNKILISMCLCLTIVMGISETGRTDRLTQVQEAETKSEGTPFILGLIPEHNIFKQLDRYKPLANYLSKKIGLNIRLKVLARYGNIVDNFSSARMDAAFFGSFTYTLAHAKLGVEVIARPEYVDGTSSYHGLIFVRKDSGIKSAKDMEGKTFAFVDKATTAGYIFPIAYFKNHGIEDCRKFLKETYFTGTHEDAIYDVLLKKTDIGAAKNTVFTRIAAADSRIKSEMDILARSADVAENGLAVRKDLDESLKQKLKDTLLNMQSDPEGSQVLKNFGARRFIGTTNDDYKGVYEFAKQIGLNLANYHYWNE